MLSKWLPSSLWGRLALTYGLVIALLIAILGAYVVGYAREAESDRIETQLGDQVVALARALPADLGPETPPDVLASEIQRIGEGLGSTLLLLDPEARVLARSRGDASSLDERDRLVAVARGGLPAPGDGARTVSVSDGWMAAASSGDGQLVVAADLPASMVGGSADRLGRNLLLAALAAATAVGILSLLIARRIAAPLEELRDQALAVSGGDLAVQVTPADTRELGDVARAFNAMTNRMADLIADSDRSRAQLETVFAHLDDGIVVTDAREQVVAINPSARGLLQVDAPAAIGMPMMSVLRDHELVELARSATREEQVKVAQVDHARNRPDIAAVAIPIPEGETWEGMTVLVLRDVSTLRRLESMRRDFVANVSHELRTPLTSIRALSEALGYGGLEDRAMAENFLGRIILEVDRLSGMVDELLDLTRLESGSIALSLRPASPAQLMERSAQRLQQQAQRANLTLVVLPSDGLPEVMADQERIEQVFLNLIHNAIKASSEGGTITLAARASGADRVEFSVADTGVGIPPDELERLFERFYKVDPSRRSDGAGLGLAITKHIVGAHGGTIWAANQPGGGAVLRFTLPVATEQDGAS